MDRTIIQIISDNWGAVVAAPQAFFAALALGALAGWLLAKTIYSNRLTHHQELIAHYRDIIDGKFPATSAPPRKRMSFGVTIVALGLIVAVIGIFSEPRKTTFTQQITKPQQPTPLSNALLPDDGGPITWGHGYLLGASGRQRNENRHPSNNRTE